MPEVTVAGLRHLLATVALGPLLLLQGATCATSRRDCQSPGTTLWASGQRCPTAPIGRGIPPRPAWAPPSQDEALCGRLVAELSPRRTLDWRLEARTGYTTADAHAHLAALPEDRFDVVVLSLGVNDVTGGLGRACWLARQAALADMLRERFAPQAVLFTALPPMHLFPCAAAAAALVPGR